MKTVELFNEEALTAGASIETDVIDVAAYAIEGYFSLQLLVTGLGTIKVEYEVSNNGKIYVVQVDAADVIASGFTATSGPGSDGKDLISFEPEPAKLMKILITETGGANAVAVSADLRIV